MHSIFTAEHAAADLCALKASDDVTMDELVEIVALLRALSPDEQRGALKAAREMLGEAAPKQSAGTSGSTS